MRRAIRSLVLCAALGMAAGFSIGLIRSVRFVELNEYFAYGMRWLALDALSRGVRTWLLRGLLWGSAAGVAFVVLRVLAAPFVTRMQRVRDELSGPQRAAHDAFLAAVALTVPALIVMLVVFNHKYILYPYTRRYWQLNGGAIAVSGAMLWFLWAVLTHWGPTAVLRRAGQIVVGLALAGALLTLLASAGSWATAPRLPADTPSIFLLTVDTLRADHLGAYGYPRATSPHLDALLAEGHVFLRAYSHAPATSSSFASIMSGHLPRDTGTYSNERLQPRMNTLAEFLRNAGYRTGAVVSNVVLRRGRNYENGFDSYDATMDDLEVARGARERIAAHTTQAALSWLKRQPVDRPVFLWVHYMDPHGPYTPPEEYADRFADVPPGPRLRVNDSVGGQGGIPSYQVLGEHRGAGYYEAQYDAEIRYFDDEFDRLVEGIHTLGRWDDSLVVFAADHGEAMGEHDYWFAHAQHLYPNQIHVPLALWGPADRITPGVRDSTVVQLIDIAPTVLDFAGIVPRRPLPGRVLFADDLEDARVFSETVYHDNYKCSLIVGGEEILYDHLEGDYRRLDIATEQYLPLTPDDAVTSRAVEDLSQMRNLRYQPERGRQKADADMMEQLKALGYTQ